MSKQVEIKNPFNDEVVGAVVDMSEQEVRGAITRAESAFAEVSAMPARDRANVLYRTAEILEENAEELSQLIVQESGKPIKASRGEVSRAIETFIFSAEEAKRIHGETIPMDAAKGGIGKMGYYIRVPIGVVGAITPFNFPLNLVVHKVGPAIAAGCSIVLKPAPQTPLSAVRLAEIMQEAGLPEGAFEVVTGDVSVGKWLTEDPRIAMITFTGSPPVAKKISEVAGLRRTTYELGGNAAVVIDEDANIDQAVGRSVIGSFTYSGQVCISTQRIYVHQSRYDEFREKFTNAVKDLQVGDPMNENTDLGPMINDGAAERVESWVNDAVKQGAKIVAGNERNGKMYRPTVLENVNEDMNVMCNEVFGPVVNLVSFENFSEALQAVDNSPFGLQAGVYTKNIDHIMEAVQKLNVGGVIINDVPTFRVDQMPYGGNKDSGLGREGPKFAIEDMTTLKMVVVNPTGA